MGGFTLIELLVTLLILGLLTGLVAPNAFSWLDSRRSATIKDEIISQLSLLPLEARLNNETLIVSNEQDLALSSTNSARVTFVPPLVILPTGYCRQSELQITVDDKTFYYPISEPNCDIKK